MLNSFINHIHDQRKKICITLLFSAFFLLLTFYRGFRIPNVYSKSHWLYTYQFGFIRRGLLGAILHPFFSMISDQGINYSIFFISIGFLVLLFLLFYFIIWYITKKRSENLDILFFLLLLCSSPALVYTVHFIGYFDSLLMGITIISCILILKQKYSLINVIINIIAMLIHELYFFLGLPLVVFVIIIKNLLIDKNSMLKTLIKAKELYFIVIPLLILFAVFLIRHPDLDGEKLLAFKQSVFKRHIYGYNENGSIFYASTTDLAKNKERIVNTWKQGRNFKYVFPIIYPFIIPMIILFYYIFVYMAKFSMLIYKKIFLFIVILTCLGFSQLIHFIAWDFSRFISYLIFNCFIFIYTFVYLDKQNNPIYFFKYQKYLPILLICFGIGLNLISKAKLYDGYQQNNLFNFKPVLNDLKKLKLPDQYIPISETLFPNSDFEKGTLVNWKKMGNAFDHQPTFGDNPLARNSSAQLKGNWWIGTYEKNNQNGMLTGNCVYDAPKGTLISKTFVIKKPVIGFLIGGGKDLQKVFVSFLVEDIEIKRFTGFFCEHMYQQIVNVGEYIGKKMTIQITDDSATGWGHINVDDFGYVNL